MTTFKTARELAARPDEVYATIADPTRLAKWWGPSGFTNAFEVCEVVPGGRWVFTMHGPDGASYHNDSTFDAVVPGREVIIRHRSPPAFRLTIGLSPSVAGTLVRWEQAFDDPAVAAAVRHIVEPANEQNLDRLAAEVAAGLAREA